LNSRENVSSANGEIFLLHFWLVIFALLDSDPDPELKSPLLKFFSSIPDSDQHTHPIESKTDTLEKTTVVNFIINAVLILNTLFPDRLSRLLRLGGSGETKAKLEEEKNENLACLNS
jgi:hypothetical protein